TAIARRRRGATCIPSATLRMNCRQRRCRIWTSNRLLPQAGHEDSKGSTMKIATGLLATMVLFAGLATAGATIRIADDRGGRIGTYLDRYQALSRSDETVAIDGLCASACTLVLGTVSHDRICVTPRARLGFHAAWDMGAHGRPVIN